MKMLLAGLVLVLSLHALPCRAQTIFVVRHAEKVDESDDPPLSAAGVERARALAHVLKDAGVTHVYVTQYARTTQTARPLLDASHLVPTRIRAEDMDGLVRALRKHPPTDVILVVGHSPTVPELVRRLAQQSLVVQHGDYDNLVMLRRHDGETFTLTRLHFGAPRP